MSTKYKKKSQVLKNVQSVIKIRKVKINILYGEVKARITCWNRPLVYKEKNKKRY